MHGTERGRVWSIGLVIVALALAAGPLMGATGGASSPNVEVPTTQTTTGDSCSALGIVCAEVDAFAGPSCGPLQYVPGETMWIKCRPAIGADARGYESTSNPTISGQVFPASVDGSCENAGTGYDQLCPTGWAGSDSGDCQWRASDNGCTVGLYDSGNARTFTSSHPGTICIDYEMQSSANGQSWAYAADTGLIVDSWQEFDEASSSGPRCWSA